MDDGYRSRKFGLTLLAFSMASLFLALQVINEGTWTGVVLACLGMYQAANVMEKRNA